jgi:hypothetical protein
MTCLGPASRANRLWPATIWRRRAPHNRISRNPLPFLLNFHDRPIRYYRHERKWAFRTPSPVRTAGASSVALRWNRTMSLIRPFAWLAALVAVLGVAGTASAQRYQPFIEPGYFEPDFQFFAPAEVGDFGGGEPPNTGVYFSYDRLYVNMTRPDGEASLFSEFEGDFTWGNRWEIGYMTEEETGWQAVLLHMSGPNEYVEFTQERLDRINDDDDPPDDPDPIIVDRNPRTYLLRDSVNVASLSSFELNKTWRRKQFHSGGVLEPLAGFRYMNFRNFVRRDDYTRFDETPAGEPLPGVPTIDGPFEQLVTETDVTQNFMIGGQLGFRAFHERGHWLLSADLRFFACHNFQYYYQQFDTTLTRYSALGGDVELQDFDRIRFYDNRNMFVWGGEVRAEAAYAVTRDISIRFGMLFLDMGQGLHRGRILNGENNEDVQIAGVTFGVTVNR